MTSTEPEVKVCVVGETSVGKTCIIHRTINDSFLSNTTPTVATNITYRYNKNNTHIKFNIWDTAGQDSYRTLLPFYWQRANVILVVFSVIDPRSYDELKQWNQFIPENVKNSSLIVLVGNKIDLKDKRVVEPFKATDLAAQYDFATYIEVSAKTGEGIQSLWDYIANQPDILDFISQQPAPIHQTKASDGDNTPTENENASEGGIISSLIGYLSSGINYIKSFF